MCGSVCGCGCVCVGGGGGRARLRASVQQVDLPAQTHSLGWGEATWLYSQSQWLSFWEIGRVTVWSDISSLQYHIICLLLWRQQPELDYNGASYLHTLYIGFHSCVLCMSVVMGNKTPSARLANRCFFSAFFCDFFKSPFLNGHGLFLFLLTWDRMAAKHLKNAIPPTNRSQRFSNFSWIFFSMVVIKFLSNFWRFENWNVNDLVFVFVNMGPHGNENSKAPLLQSAVESFGDFVLNFPLGGLHKNYF